MTERTAAENERPLNDWRVCFEWRGRARDLSRWQRRHLQKNAKGRYCSWRTLSAATKEDAHRQADTIAFATYWWPVSIVFQRAHRRRKKSVALAAKAKYPMNLTTLAGATEFEWMSQTRDAARLLHAVAGDKVLCGRLRRNQLDHYHGDPMKHADRRCTVCEGIVVAAKLTLIKPPPARDLTSNVLVRAAAAEGRGCPSCNPVTVTSLNPQWCAREKCVCACHVDGEVFA